METRKDTGMWWYGSTDMKERKRGLERKRERKESKRQRKRNKEAGMGGRKQGPRERQEKTAGFKHTLKLPIHTRKGKHIIHTHTYSSQSFSSL